MKINSNINKSFGADFTSLARVAFGLASAAFLAPAPALAAGGGDAGLSSLLFPIINFSIFSFLVSKIYKGNVAGLLKGRSLSTKEQLNKSANELRSATADFEVLRERLSNIDIEKRELFARYDTEGANQSRQILEAANLQAQRREADADRQVDAEASKAEKTIRSMTVQRAIQLAEARFRSEHSAESDSALRQDAINSL